MPRPAGGGAVQREGVATTSFQHLRICIKQEVSRPWDRGDNSRNNAIRYIAPSNAHFCTFLAASPRPLAHAGRAHTVKGCTPSLSQGLFQPLTVASTSYPQIPFFGLTFSAHSGRSPAAQQKLKALKMPKERSWDAHRLDGGPGRGPRHHAGG